ncbi:hypothetical protein F5X97DRAFT_345984 [Nemania serpens]|nr:hypothetical protein F5X97DRAFT_345984 [Nemania serpens]
MQEVAPPRYRSEAADRARLAEPLRFEFSGRVVPNRFMKGAMTEQLCTFDSQRPENRGIPTKNIERCYERWGRGGIGMILSGNIMIDPTALESTGDPVIPREAGFSGPRFAGFQAMARAAKAHGSLMVGQINHPGRLCLSQESPVAASAIAVESSRGIYAFPPPHEASKDEIRDIVEGFAHAAEYLAKAGWDGVEMHGAHHFLLSGFLSPKSNQRTDEYGGSLENRMRLILEVGREIRRRTPPDFILGIKINSTEFQDTGFVTAEARQLCTYLESHRFDFVELSGGSYEKVMYSHLRDSTVRREAFFIDFADQIVPALTKTKVFITGGLRTVGGMVRALDTVDGVGLGRPLTDEWHLCKDILEGRVDGAVIPEIDPGEFWLALMAGNRNMRLEVVDQLRAGYKEWTNNKNTENELSYYEEVDAPHGSI